MRSFRFKLEKLLDIRKYREREWELKLAEATGKVMVINRGIEDVVREKARVFRERRYASGPDMAYMMTLASLYMERLSSELSDLSVKLEEAELKRREVREGYLAASRERKSLDTLKDKRSREFYKEQEAAEMKAVDDINTASFIRKSKSADGMDMEGKR